MPPLLVWHDDRTPQLALATDAFLWGNDRIYTDNSKTHQETRCYKTHRAPLSKQRNIKNILFQTCWNVGIEFQCMQIILFCLVQSTAFVEKFCKVKQRRRIARIWVRCIEYTTPPLSNNTQQHLPSLMSLRNMSCARDRNASAARCCRNASADLPSYTNNMLLILTTKRVSERAKKNQYSIQQFRSQFQFFL